MSSYLRVSKLKCKQCFKPPSRRLSMFEAKDDYECYADSYVKCFWNLCDYQTGNEDVAATKSTKGIITQQPTRQGIRSPAL